MENSNIVQLLKQISKEEREASKPCDFLIGKVVSKGPNKVKISERITLTDEFLVFLCSTYNTIQTGDSVVIIRQAGGQQFLILDKVV